MAYFICGILQGMAIFAGFVLCKVNCQIEDDQSDFINFIFDFEGWIYKLTNINHFKKYPNLYFILNILNIKNNNFNWSCKHSQNLI